MALSNPALFVTLILCVVVFASIEAAKEKKKSTKIVQTSSASAPSAGWFGGSQASPGDDAIRTSCEEVEDFVVNVRRELHRFPELMYKETKTSAYIQSKLKELDVNFSPGWAVNTKTDRITGPGGTGIVATIGTGTSPVVLLRADIDALPIHEEVESDIKSQTDGQMHACGHDGHTAMLLGAAKVLKVLEASGKIKGTVKLMFQPAEEGGAGGAAARGPGRLPSAALSGGVRSCGSGRVAARRASGPLALSRCVHPPNPRAMRRRRWARRSPR